MNIKTRGTTENESEEEKMFTVLQMLDISLYLLCVTRLNWIVILAMISLYVCWDRILS